MPDGPISGQEIQRTPPIVRLCGSVRWQTAAMNFQIHGGAPKVELVARSLEEPPQPSVAVFLRWPKARLLQEEPPDDCCAHTGRSSALEWTSRGSAEHGCRCGNAVRKLVRNVVFGAGM